MLLLVSYPSCSSERITFMFIYSHDSLTGAFVSFVFIGMEMRLKLCCASTSCLCSLTHADI